MPKILRIHNRLIIGGPTLNVLYLTKYLAPEFETILVVGQKEDHEKDANFLAEAMGIKIVFVPEMGRSIDPFKDRKALKKLKAIIKEYKPDIVHTHAAKPGAVGRWAAIKSKVPVIVHTYHGHVFHSYFNKWKTKFIIGIEQFLGKKSDALVAISEQQKIELTDQFNIAPKNKFRIVPLGFELDKFQTDLDKKRKTFREEFKLTDDVIAVGIIGRLVPVKNHQLFLKGIHHVLNHSSKKIKAFIIGDGETRAELEKMCDELEIKYTTTEKNDPAASVIFTSWRSDVDTINAGLDIITLTSLNEGTPVSLIEAQAANKPIVSTKVGGISDIVIEGETALLSDVNDTDGFCKNLLQLVNDDELRSRLGKQGAGFVMQKFSVHRLAKDMAALYNELLQRKRN